MSNEAIVVLGSKPQAPLPAIAAPVVLTANNAVELGALYRQKYGSKVIAFVPAEEIKNREHIRTSFIKAQPDKIMLLSATPADADFVRGLGLTSSAITVVSHHERTFLLRHSLGWRWMLVMFERLFNRGLAYTLKEALPDLLWRKKMPWLPGSTGLDAIFYALQSFPHAQVVSAGIGLQPGEHFSGEGTFTSKTAKADRTTMKFWPPHKRPALYTTDDVMAELAPMQKWQGEVYYHGT